jgi:dCTP diphosphatase
MHSTTISKRLTLNGLRNRLRQFARARDWEQFHSPKNLCMALSGEVGELTEIFQWLSEQDSYSLKPAKRRLVADELSDILIYLVRLADRLEIDLLAAARRKIVSNEKKYPAARVRGSARKYSEYR